ncbi:MAG: 50S ribosomal protein L24e [Nanoarchaeota archaeon]|nr:50S ribosomal protein L24e [Nanoarchaeota archaeon]
MVKCSFCGITIHKGTGKMYIKKDAKVFYFCANKCEKNMLKLGRKPRTTEWTVEYKNLKASAKKPAKGEKSE